MAGLSFGGRRRNSRKVDRFLADKSLVIDYKDPSSLKYFVTERGKMGGGGARLAIVHHLALCQEQQIVELESQSSIILLNKV